MSDTDPFTLVLDATQGYARMNLTTVRGSVRAVDENDSTAQLIMDLQTINHRRVAEFDFTGTDHDAEPDNYQINTGGLNLDSLTGATPVKVRGFVQPFGQAPADFNAQALISVADMRAFMKVRWTRSSPTAIQSATADGLVLNLDEVGAFHHLIRGWVVTDLTQLGTAPMLAPRTEGTGLFVLRYRGIAQVVPNFEDFANVLQGHMEDGAAVHKMVAVGDFDDVSAILTADVIEIRLF